MFTADKVTEIFFMADEFNKVFCSLLKKGAKRPAKEAITELSASLWPRLLLIVLQLWLSLPGSH